MKKMSYEEFKRAVSERVEQTTGNQPVIQKFHKNNGVTLDGLTIHTPESNIEPIFYLAAYYQEYMEGNGADSFDCVCDKILQECKQKRPVEEFDIESFSKFENVKDKLRIKIINFEKNRQLLEKAAYVQFLDLAIVFVVDVGAGFDASATIMIYNSHLDIWRKTTEEIFELAMQNIQKDYVLASMADMLDGMGSEMFCTDMDDVNKMYVLTNRKKIYGASAIFCEEALIQYAEKMNCEKVVILPSSIHEVILLPYEREDSLECLDDMIKEVNETVLAPDEYLSNHVYVYDRKENKIFA